MKLGMFSMPQHPPERDLREGYEWDIQNLVWADELGFDEAWIGEHHACPWEPLPAPDMLVVEGLRATKNMRIGTGGICLPYHHPVEVANRVAMIDHISEGRFIFGVAASGLPSDHAMFGVDGHGGENRAMFQEAMDIILGMWSNDPGWRYEGKYWKAHIPEEMLGGILKPHLKPLQLPHPPIGVAGVSTPSGTLEWAGEHGYVPMSLNLNPSYVASHWDSVVRGAERAERVPRRAQWLHAREVLVADTDKEAWEHSVNGQIGRMYGEYFIPLMKGFEFVHYLKQDPDVSDADVTPEYCAEHNWLIGSPDTVVEKIEKIYEQCGGFGGILVICYDYLDKPEVWRHSFELLSQEVMPRLAHLTGD